MAAGRGAGPGSPFAIADGRGVVVVPGAGRRLGDRVSATALAEGLAIEVEEEAVGTLITGPRMTAFLPAPAEQFLQRVSRALLTAGIVAAALGLVIGVALAGRLTSTLRDLTAATQALAGGAFGRQVEVRSNDELGELAASFNRMSADLARAQSSRRQMTADIAHELRTPLSLILGHAEALHDGVLPRTDENLQVIYGEARRLNRVVEDLRTLSLAEAGELSLSRRWAQPGRIARAVAAARQSAVIERGIDLELELQEAIPALEVDADRIQQAVGNLLDNALRHTPAGGSAVLRVAASGGHVRFIVEDSGPGIPAQDLPRLFERFYRADPSRSREEGGSGLGLAIAKSLVEAHSGQIRVENREEGGARFVIELPADRASSSASAT